MYRADVAAVPEDRDGVENRGVTVLDEAAAGLFAIQAGDPPSQVERSSESASPAVDNKTWTPSIVGTVRRSVPRPMRQEATCRRFRLFRVMLDTALLVSHALQRHQGPEQRNNLEGRPPKPTRE